MQYNRSKKKVFFLIGFFFKRAYPAGEAQHVCAGLDGGFFKDKGIGAVRNLKEGSHGCKKEQETLRGS